MSTNHVLNVIPYFLIWSFTKGNITDADADAAIYSRTLLLHCEPMGFC